MNFEEAINLLKESYKENDYEKQIKGFINLGNLYSKESIELINESNDLQKQNHKKYRYLTHATALYTYALAISIDFEKNKKFLERSLFYKKTAIDSIKEVEKIYLESIGIDDSKISDWSLDESHQEFLETLRYEVLAKLKQQSILEITISSQFPENTSRLKSFQLVEEYLTEYHLTTQHIYQFVSKSLRSFVKNLIEECKQTLGNPPCEYAVICFGSLARDEATPYSDLEFGILIAEDKKENEEYFRQLTRLLHLKVLCLGETTPRMQDIERLKGIGLLERYAKNPVRNGFTFDGQNKDGRKTPLGNKYFEGISEEQQYELILTPEKMVALCDEKSTNKDPHLFTVLTTAGFIDGEKSLFESYQQKIDEFSLDFLQDKSQKLLSEVMRKFEPNMGISQKAEGHVFNAKYDFYRLINMVIENVCLYYKVRKNTLIESINSLQEKGILTEEGASNLKIAASCIANIRLKTYLANQSQDNYIVPLGGLNDKEDNSLIISKYFRVQQEQIFEIYYALIPLYYAAQEFLREAIKGFREKSKDRVFSLENYYDRSKLVLGHLHFKLNLIFDAINLFEEYIREGLKSIELFQQQIVEITLKEEIEKIDKKLINIYCNLEKAYEFLEIIHREQFDRRHIYCSAKKTEMLDKACLIDRKYYTEEEKKIVDEYLEKSRKISDEKAVLAFKYWLQDCVESKNKLFHDEDVLKKYGFHIEDEQSVLNEDQEAENYFSQNNYEKAIEVANKTLAKKISKYGDFHPKTAITYGILARSYEKMRDKEKSLEYARLHREIVSKTETKDQHIKRTYLSENILYLDEINQKIQKENEKTYQLYSKLDIYEDENLEKKDEEANNYLKEGNFEKSEEISRTTLRHKKDKYALDDKRLAISRSILARSYFLSNQYDKALIIAEESYFFLKRINETDSSEAKEMEILIEECREKVLERDKLQRSQEFGWDSIKKTDQMEIIKHRLRLYKIYFDQMEPKSDKNDIYGNPSIDEKLTHLFSDKAQESLQMGNVYLLQNNTEAAKQFYKILGFDPTDINTHWQLITIYSAADRLDDVITYYEIIIHMQEKCRIAYHNLGCFYHAKALQMKDNNLSEEYLKKSEESFEKGIKIAAEEKENCPGLFAGYANFLIQNKKFKDALPYLHSVISKDVKENNILIFSSMESAIYSQELKNKILDAGGEIKTTAIFFAYPLIITAYQALSILAGQEENIEEEKLHSDHAKYYLIKFKEEVEKDEMREENFFSYQLLAYAYNTLNYKDEAEKILLQANQYEKNKLSKFSQPFSLEKKLKQFCMVNKKSSAIIKNDLTNISKKKRMADRALSSYGLKRGFVGNKNNSLLDSIFQQVYIFSKYNYPEKDEIFLIAFIEFFKSKLEINEVLNFRDEVEAVKLISATENYLSEKMKLDVGLEFFIYEEDEKNGINFSNVSNLKDLFFKKGKENIPIHMIFNGDFYAPVFFSKEINNYSQIQYEKIMKAALNFIKEGHVALKKKEYKLALKKHTAAKEIFKKFLGENHYYVSIMQEKIDLCEKNISLQTNIGSNPI